MRFTAATGSLASAAILALSQTALAQSWTDHFDFYTAGDIIDPNGQQVGVGNDWESWSNGIGASSVTNNPPAFSPPNSLQNNPGSDTVNNFGPGFATSGQWSFDAWVYHAGIYTGESFWIMLNTYSFGGPYNWSIQVNFNGDTGQVICDCNGANGAGPYNIIYDTWVPIHADIDLDGDLVDVFYNGDSLTDGAAYGWSSGVFGGGGGLMEIQGLNLFPASNNFPMFYDSMTLAPNEGGLGELDTLCVPNPNSVGEIARMKLTGTGVAGDPVFASVTGGVPGEFGYFLSGLSGGLYVVPPLSSGVICMGSPLRYNGQNPFFHVYQFDGNGDAGPVELQTNGTYAPVPPVQGGDTRHFQAWHRDQPAGLNSNFSDAYSVQFTAGSLPRVSSVSPGSGGDGTIVTINGSGFDPNPDNNCVFLGNRTVSATVLTASTTQLTARVGASEDTGPSGPVQVVRGIGTPLPDHVENFGPGMSTGSDRAVFNGTATGAGAAFAFGPATPTTIDFQNSFGVLTADVGPLGTWTNGTQILVDIHIKAGGSWCDTMLTITFGPGFGSAADCAAHIAAQITALGTFNVSLSGTSIGVSKPGGTTGFGSIKVL